MGANLTVPCEDQVVAELVELRQRAALLMSLDGWAAEDEYFFAEQNAQLVHNAERYYREMYQGRVSSWNLRDQHMTETLGESGRPSRSSSRTGEDRRLGAQFHRRRRPSD